MIIYNGALVGEESIIKVTNRSYQYGDALFETIKWSSGKALFWNDHCERLLHSMELLKMDVPDNFTASYLNDLFFQLVKQNNCETSARIRLQVFRKPGGFYLPENNKAEFSITAQAYAGTDYVVNTAPLQLGIYKDFYKAATPLSTIKSANGLLYIMASLYAKENSYDDCFLLNDKGNVIETTNSNLFIVTGTTIKTPPLADGCLNGIMRKQVLKFAFANDLNFEEKSLTISEVLDADEIILTNTIGGIRLVKCNYNIDWLPKLILKCNGLLNNIQ